MKRFVTVLAVVAAMFVFTTQESQAQYGGFGRSGISIGIGSGGFGGFNRGFGGYGGGFNRGFGGGFGGVPFYGGGFNRGVSVGYSSFRPTYGRSYYQPSRSYYGGGGGFYRGGGRGCGY